MNLRRLPCAVIGFILAQIVDAAFGKPEEHAYESRTSPMYASNEELDKEIK